MTISPLYDVLFVECEPDVTKSALGLELPSTLSTMNYKTAHVMECGEGKLNDDGSISPLRVKRGDRILFSKGVGMEMTLGTQKYMILRENQVMAILGEDK
jgi:chaperonin GroES